MVEVVELVCKLVDISTDLMRCFLLECVLHNAVETGYGKHQSFLAVALRCQKCAFLQFISLFFIFSEDGFCTNDRVQDVRTGVSLEGSKSLNIEYIIFRCLVGQVTVFNSRQSDNLCRSSCIRIFYAAVLHDLLIHLIVDLADQTLQTHNAALTGLERFSVFSVHGTKADKGKSGIIIHQFCFSCTAETLYEVKLLTFVCQIADLVRLVQFHTLDDGCQVCRIIQSCSIGF